MNNTKILESIHAMTAYLNDDDKKTFDFCRQHPNDIKSILKYSANLGALMADFIGNIEKDISAETAKKSGRASALKAAERIIKSAKGQPKTALYGAWLNSSGKQCICDGFRAVRLIQPLELEKIPENILPIDLDNLMKYSETNSGEPLPLPDPAELKTYIKTEKARKKAIKDNTPPVWSFGDDLPDVNAQYLLDMLEIFPDSIAIPAESGTDKRAIYFTSAGGDGLLMPVFKKR